MNKTREDPQLPVAEGITKEGMIFSLPPPLKDDRSTEALGEAAAEVLAARPAELDRLRIIPNIDGQDEGVLDILARDFKVDWWNPNYSLEEKRRTVKSSWKVHKLLGTKTAVETALRAIYPNSWVEPWFEYEDGRPYHFRIHIDLSDVMGDETRPWHVMERVQYYQSLRDHLDEIRYTIEAKQPAVLGLGTGMGANAAIGVTEGRDEFDFRQSLYFAHGMGAQTTVGVTEERDTFTFSGEVRAGAARAGAQTRFPVPEDVRPPDRVSILRTGGAFTMIAPPIFPTPPST